MPGEDDGARRNRNGRTGVLSDLDVTLLHHRYRQGGGEERCVLQLAELLRGEIQWVRLLERSSAQFGGVRAPAAAAALALGGSPARTRFAAAPGRRQLVHAHNVHPTYGWRALRDLRRRGAAVVLHLHNYRLFCATGLAFRGGRDCFDCAPRSTWHGVRHNCRENRAEALPYAIGIGAWQKRLLAQADVVVAPSGALLADLADHGVHAGGEVLSNWLPAADFATASRAGEGTYALMTTRVTRDKGVETAIRAAAASGVPLKIAGEGPWLEQARALAAQLNADVELPGAVYGSELKALRTAAAFAIVPSLWREVQPFAALESLAAALPLITSDTPALNDLTTPDLTFPRGDHHQLAQLMRRLKDAPGERSEAGAMSLARAHANHSEDAALKRLTEIYELALDRRSSA